MALSAALSIKPSSLSLDLNLQQESRRIDQDGWALMCRWEAGLWLLITDFSQEPFTHQQIGTVVINDGEIVSLSTLSAAIPLAICNVYATLPLGQQSQILWAGCERVAHRWMSNVVAFT